MSKIKINWKDIDPNWVSGADNPKELAGLVANEARYFFNKYKYTDLVAVPASEDKTIFKFVNNILAEREMDFDLEPELVTSILINDEISWSIVWYKNGLCVNIAYYIFAPKYRAASFKLTEGVEVPKEFEGKFKFSHSKSTVAGFVRGTYFIIKGEYDIPKKHENIINVVPEVKQ